MKLSKDITNLLIAIQDVAPSGHPTAHDINTADKKYLDLFQQYISDLIDVKFQAEECWRNIIKSTEETTGLPTHKAQEEALLRHPSPVISDSDVIQVIRKYWLKCVDINSKMEPSKQIAPEYFMLGWLAYEHYDELADFISRMRYWPIGLTKDGQWI